jgi:type I restriction enzyme, S subunit
MNIEELRALMVSMPSAGEQREIVRIVRHFLSLADSLQIRCESCAGMLQSVVPASLTKAFRGELLPRVPDEPLASKLVTNHSVPVDSPAPVQTPHTRGNLRNVGRR